MILPKIQLFIGLILLAMLSIFFSLFKGSTLIHLYPLDPIAKQILFDLRLPRTLAAFATGGLLALAGAMMQVLLRNPLADPYILGISGGAAVGSLLCILTGLTGYALTGGAWLGSLIAIGMVFLLARRQQHHLLLTGIAVAAGLSALISFILVISSDTELRSMLFWLLGDLSYAHLPMVEMIILLAGLVISLSLAPQLNILARGEQEAKALGLHTSRLQLQIYVLSSLLTASAVTLAGCIGFIGLIVPHLFRLMFGYDHRYLIPGSVLLGGSLLTVADTVARSIMAPQQLPVGILTALIGVPVFLFLLHRHPT